mgnify:CR=1 FL=1
MEVEVQWDGNPNIVLDVKMHLGVALPIQVMEGFLAYLMKNLFLYIAVLN